MMPTTNQKAEEQVKRTAESMQGQAPEGTATHSGWMHFYSAFAKHREDCMLLGKNVLGNNFQLAASSLSAYHSALYSLAQQIFSFYEETLEEQLTSDWLELGDKVNDFLSKISDRDFRAQMVLEGEVSLDRDLKIALLKYFNKVDRLAAAAGLHVGRENKGASEPKKGLIGFNK